MIVFRAFGDWGSTPSMPSMLFHHLMDSVHRNEAPPKNGPSPVKICKARFISFHQIKGIFVMRKALISMLCTCVAQSVTCILIIKIYFSILKLFYFHFVICSLYHSLLITNEEKLWKNIRFMIKVVALKYIQSLKCWKDNRVK